VDLANNIQHMILILIPIAWLTVVTLFVAVCRAAARGDSPSAQLGEWPSVDTAIDGLILWEDQAEVAMKDTRPRKLRRLARHRVPHNRVPHSIR
jgi:hypothetical protein